MRFNSKPLLFLTCAALPFVCVLLFIVMQIAFDIEYPKTRILGLGAIVVIPLIPGLLLILVQDAPHVQRLLLLSLYACLSCALALLIPVFHFFVSCGVLQMCWLASAKPPLMKNSIYKEKR